MPKWNQIDRKKVFVVVDMSAGLPAREVLSGIFTFANTGHPWSLRLIQLPSDSLATAVNGAFDENVDGLIVTCESDSVSTELIAAAHVPAVFVHVRNALFEKKNSKTAFIRNDDEGIGKAGARYLSSLGNVNAYGFVPDVEGRIWSTLRERAFRAELEKGGRIVQTFTNGSNRPAEDQANLVLWLKQLPKPCALMAAYDYRATHVADACQEAGLSIPEQVVLLGVDNDELLCSSTTPPLSSIKPDHVQEGFQAAVALDRLFRLGARAKRYEFLCRMKGIVERESTRPYPPAATLVRRTLTFIGENAHVNLRVGDVAAALGVSRRLLERRFRTIQKESINDCILSQRLAVVKRLLGTTSRSCAKIASECGFPNANYLSHLFKRKTGLSMRQYRVQNAKP